MADFCTLTYTFTTDDSAVDACLEDVDSPTPFEFDIRCDQTTIAGVLGTAVEDDFVITWTATLTSPYSASSISSAFSVASLKIKNPCNEGLATITGPDLTAKTYIITEPAVTFAQPAIVINTQFASVCGDLVY